MAFERPQSANISAERKRLANQKLQTAMMAGQKEDMMVTGLNGKKRYPSTNPKDDIYKWK